MKLLSFLKGWLPLCAVITIVFGTMYVAIQQSIRSEANDPQIARAEDTAALIAGGRDPLEVIPSNSIEIASSLSPFVVVYDSNGKPIAGNGMLDGALPRVPQGVLEEANKRGGEYTVTWQPKSGTRIALAVVSYTNGYVASGRSLREVEKRIGTETYLVGLGWIASLILSAFFIFIRYGLEV